MNELAEPQKPKTRLRGAGAIAAIMSVALLTGATAWAQLTEINGAVIANGSVVVVGKPKSIQHLDGGVVELINVDDGDRVKAGDTLIKLDDTLLVANLDIYRNRLAESLARIDRLEAERRGEEGITFTTPPAYLKDVELEARRGGQIELFKTRAAVQSGRVEQLSEKILQYGNQIEGVDALISSKEDQLDLLGQELASVSALEKKGLARAPQLLGLQRSRADLLGQIAEHQSELARISNSIRDTELEILQGQNQFREEAVTELTEITQSAEELTQQILSTQKQLDRIEIRSPVSGIVHELQIVTIGGVVAPGATVVQIIPADLGLEFETQVAPVSIDQVYVGQEATLRVMALNQRTTPEISAEIVGLSPNSILDEATGQSFYRARLRSSEAELAKLGDVLLVPGMPVDAFIQTGERTVMSYLVRPMMDQLGRAFREE